jgi:hypothetical protein
MTKTMYDPRTEEIFHVAGDVPDPTGYSSARGQQSTVNLQASRTAEVQIRYKDTIIFGDVYQYEGAPIRVIIMCPRCRNTLTITGDNKRIEYDLGAAPSIGGKISIEPFTCPFEAPDAGAHKRHSGEGAQIITGMKMCNWRVGVENNKALDA